MTATLIGQDERMEVENELIGARIRHERERKHWSQPQLIERLAAVGFVLPEASAIPALSRIERGERVVTAPQLHKFAQVFGITTDALLTPQADEDDLLKETASNALVDLIPALDRVVASLGALVDAEVETTVAELAGRFDVQIDLRNAHVFTKRLFGKLTPELDNLLKMRKGFKQLAERGAQKTKADLAQLQEQELRVEHTGDDTPAELMKDPRGFRNQDHDPWGRTDGEA